MNRKEYNQAVKSHSNGIYRYAVKFLGDEVTAQDVVQDCFEKLWNNLAKVDGARVKAWLFQTAHNAMVNTVRREARMEPMGPHHGKGNYQANFSFEWSDLLEDGLKALPPLQKSILLLRDLEGYPYQEIGQILGLNESQVKVYLFRARKTLKEKLQSMIPKNEICQ
ncbi:MAG: RNA polymerase sigma factor [Bacteroidia bacterium]|nr:RNA polymerase sigma factor [Bacteroidia bacterium]